jgi:hypothetical protein
MNVRRASREKRIHAIRLAIHRVRLGRVRVVPLGTRLSVVAVAKEAGISPATIHTTYPDLAEEIRRLAGKSLREKRREDLSDLKKCKDELVQAKKEIAALKRELASVASRYASVIIKIEQLMSLLSPAKRALYLGSSKLLK